MRPDVLSADQVRSLRLRAMKRAAGAIDALADIADGSVDAKNAMPRVAAARALLAKVLPDISASYVEQHVHHHHDVKKLSKAELQELIAASSSRGDSASEKSSQFNELKTIDGELVPESLPKLSDMKGVGGQND